MAMVRVWVRTLDGPLECLGCILINHNARIWPNFAIMINPQLPSNRWRGPIPLPFHLDLRTSCFIQIDMDT